MNIDFTTQGTCSKRIEAEVENGIVKEVRFTGGCNGNLQGICALVKGMPVDEVIRKLEGIRCGSRLTSCPDSGIAVKLVSTCICQIQKPMKACIYGRLFRIVWKKLLFHADETLVSSGRYFFFVLSKLLFQPVETIVLS